MNVDAAHSFKATDTMQTAKLHGENMSKHIRPLETGWQGRAICSAYSAPPSWERAPYIPLSENVPETYFCNFRVECTTCALQCQYTCSGRNCRAQHTSTQALEKHAQFTPRCEVNPRTSVHAILKQCHTVFGTRHHTSSEIMGTVFACTVRRARTTANQYYKHKVSTAMQEREQGGVRAAVA